MTASLLVLGGGVSCLIHVNSMAYISRRKQPCENAAMHIRCVTCNVHAVVTTTAPKRGVPVYRLGQTDVAGQLFCSPLSFARASLPVSLAMT
jgi:hypothetical protein